MDSRTASREGARGSGEEIQVVSLYYPERRALFLHIPRTGGSWIGHCSVLAGIPVQKWGRVCEMYRPRKHTILPHYRPELLTKVEWIFCFVRHPFDYYVSVWRFTTRSATVHSRKMRDLVFSGVDPAAINEAVNRWKPDFFEWLEEMLEEEPGWMTRLLERFVGPQGGEFAHFIGRTETLEMDMDRVMEMLGYSERWEESRKDREKVMYAKNQIRGKIAPHVKLTDGLKERIERSERVMLRRFFGEQTFTKRVYRDFQGVPIR